MEYNTWKKDDLIKRILELEEQLENELDSNND